MTLLAFAVLVLEGKNGIAGILTYMHACSYIQSFPPGYFRGFRHTKLLTVRRPRYHNFIGAAVIPGILAEEMAMYQQSHKQPGEIGGC